MKNRWRQLRFWQRLALLGVAGLVLFSASIPVLGEIHTQHAYALDAKTMKLVGSTSSGLAAKFSYDQQHDAWQFNKAGMMNANSTSQSPAEVAQSLQAKVGGADKKDASLYSVNLPTKAAQPITYYDSNTGLSFSMTPEFQTSDGHKVSDKLVYPAKSGAKLIYSAKTNGMKEDIILTKPMGDELRFTYHLNLPDTLVAKIQNDGSVGVFSADPILFGNITYGANADRAKVESARQTAEKNHLLFALPAPVIKQAQGTNGSATHAHFTLFGDTLSVEASGLKDLHYPVSIDPSVVVTSASDFVTGNNDSSIDYVSDEIRNAALGGGTVSSWTSTSGASAITLTGGAVAYNGFLYVVGGSGQTNVKYGAINAATGAVGSLVNGPDLPDSGAVRGYAGTAVYNGYIYVYGGIYYNTTTVVNDVLYAPIQSDGSVGAFIRSANAMALTACRFGATVYNGYLYAMGGATSSTANNCANTSGTNSGSVEYAPIQANGDVGAWTISSRTITARKDVNTVAYNGYIYNTSGTTDGITNTFAVQYAPLLANGDLGAWITSSVVSSSAYRAKIAVYNGYIYISGGGSSTNVYYAPIKSSGDIGAFALTTPMNVGRYAHFFVPYNGYIYYGDGQGAGGALSDINYGKIDAGGSTSSTVATTAYGSTITASTGAGTFVYNNYIYSLGGYDGSAYSSVARYATLSADGTIGTWATTAALATPVAGGTGLSSFGLAIYNNYVYVIAGTTSVSGTVTFVSSIQYSTFNTNGTINAWTLNATDYPGTVTNQAAAAYNGYIYMRGISGGGASNRIYSVAINSNGTLGTWTFSPTNLNVYSTYYGTLINYGSYLYSAGGITSGGVYQTGVEYAAINSDGSLGTWTATSSLNTGRDRHQLVAYNGCVYAVGGQVDAAPTETSSVEKACINTDGSLTSWTTTTPMGITASTFGAAAYADRIYIISGSQNAARVKTNYYMTINNGGSAGIGAWATSANTFTNGRYGHGSVAYNGYLYVIGGRNSTNRMSDVQYAAIGSGSVGTWNTTTSLPSVASNQVTQLYNGYIYYCGGKDDTTPQANCYYTKTNSDGTLGNWIMTTALPISLDSAGSASANGYMYILGGAPAITSVLYAPYNADGSLGSWTATTSLPAGRALNGAIASNKYIYSLGGYNSSTNVYYNDVYYAPLNANGTVGTWSSTTSLKTARNYLSPQIINGNLYIYAGAGGSTNYSNVDYAPLNANGTLGGWTSTTSMTTFRYGHAVVYYQGYVYATGGASANLNTAQSSPVFSIPRVGQYSKLVDLGGQYNISAISATGTAGNLNSVLFQSASSSGALGLSQSRSSITAVAPCIVGTTRYVYLQATLDGTTTATFPDSSSSARTVVNDMTVKYTGARPDTVTRLRQGQSFANETIQPLDTCGS